MAKIDVVVEIEHPRKSRRFFRRSFVKVSRFLEFVLGQNGGISGGEKEGRMRK